MGYEYEGYCNLTILPKLIEETRNMVQCANRCCEVQLLKIDYSHDFMSKIKLFIHYLYLFNFENVCSNIKQ